MQIAGAGVYVIRAESPAGRIKIGVTTNIHARLAALQTASPVKLEVIAWKPGARRVFEQALHGEFADHRIHGEWFQVDDVVLLNLMGRMKSGYSRDDLRVLRTRSIGGGNRTIGRCILCHKNVQAKMKFIRRPGGGRGKKARRPSLTHVSCGDPYGLG
jgi:hypothetical protein